MVHFQFCKNAPTITDSFLPILSVHFASWLTWVAAKKRVTATMIKLMFFSGFLNFPTSPFAGGVFVLDRATITETMMTLQLKMRQNNVFMFLSTRLALAVVR